jgi:hypothetical protein
MTTPVVTDLTGAPPRDQLVLQSAPNEWLSPPRLRAAFDFFGQA